MGDRLTYTITFTPGAKAGDIRSTVYWAELLLHDESARRVMQRHFPLPDEFELPGENSASTLRRFVTLTTDEEIDDFGE